MATLKGKSVVVTLGPARLSYVNVFTAAADPSGRMKKSLMMLMPKSDQKLVADCKKGIQDMLNIAVQAGFFKQAQIPSLHIPLRDGDAEIESNGKGPEYAGMYFMNAKTDESRTVGVVDVNRQPIIDPDQLYSGCWGAVNLAFYAFDMQTKGIGVGLRHVMKLKDDERLDGTTSAEDAFDSFDTSKFAPAEGDVEAGGSVALPDGTTLNPFANLT